LASRFPRYNAVRDSPARRWGALVLWTEYSHLAANSYWALDIGTPASRFAGTVYGDALELKGTDTNCIVHTRQVIETIGGWDEACQFLEDWDFFTRCLMHDPTRVYWVPKVLVEYRQIYGVDVDGQCATTMQDAAHKRIHWQYLIEKWQSQPGFAKTALRLTAKYLGDSVSPND
jgi:hypothetical protein